MTFAIVVSAVAPDAGEAHDDVAVGIGAEGSKPAAPIAGDLTHLTLTATGKLDAFFVSPVDGGVATNAGATFDVRTKRGAGVELTVNAVVVPFSRIGKQTVDGASGDTHYFYYGVALRPGPNDVVITALGAAGVRGAPVSATVYGPGPLKSQTLAISGPMRADALSPDTITIQGFDQWQHPAMAGTTIRLTVLHGDIRVAPLAQDPLSAQTLAANVSTQFVDVPLGPGGIAVVRMVPGLQAGTIDVSASCGDLQTTGHFFLAPNIRPPLVNGLFTLGMGNVPGDPAASDFEPDGVNSRRGRIALYATGAIDPKTLGTIAYDTANSLSQTTATGAFIDDTNARPYTTYGDASIRRDDALSRDHLFALLDRGQSSFRWGEFNAVTSSATDPLGAYSQLVDGARLEIAGPAAKIRGFAARNDVGYDRRVFLPSGLATSGQTLFADIVAGSQTVTLVSLDRRTGGIVSQTVLTPNVDYVLDDAGGQFRFINIPLPFDDFGNPQQIVLTYEYARAGATARTTGGRTEVSLKNSMQIGMGYVNDSSGAGNLSLFSQDIAGPLRNGTWSFTHIANTGVLDPSNGLFGGSSRGSAYRGSFTMSAGTNTLSGSIDDTSAGFSNPFGGLSTPGLQNLRFNFAHQLANGAGNLAIAATRDANSGFGIANTESQLSVLLHRAFSKHFGMTAGVVTQSYRSATPNAAVTAAPSAGSTPGIPVQNGQDGVTTQATLAADWAIRHNLTVNAARIQSVSGPQSVSQPSQSTLQLSYQTGDAGRAYVRENWSAAAAQSFAVSTVGLTSAAATTRSTEIGIERTLSPTTSVDSEYLIQRDGSGSDLYAAMGVRQRINLSKNFKGDAYFQQADGRGTNANGFTAYGASVNYRNAADTFHSTAALQQRNGSSNGTTFSLAATGAILPDISLFASIIGSRAPQSKQSDARIGLAWRPANNDRGVTLLQYERAISSSLLLPTTSGVLSLEQIIRPSDRTELTGRFAYKLDGDASYAAHTSLVGVRADQRIGPHFDVGFETRHTFVAGIGGAANTGFGAELGVRLGNTTRVAGGYNFRGSADPSLSETPVKRGLYFTVTSLVDRFFGWAKR